MLPINFKKYKFKLRSLPNEKNGLKYLEAFTYLLVVFLIYNIVYICLFSDGFMPTLPILFILSIPIVFLYVYEGIEKEFQNVSRETFKEIIVYVRLKQNQSLKEKLEMNPEILKETYKKKSLLYWAKYYNNLQANSIIIKEMKRPK